MTLGLNISLRQVENIMQMKLKFQQFRFLKKIIAENGRRQVGRIISGERGRNIIVMETTSGSGTFLPSHFFFLFPWKKLILNLWGGGGFQALNVMETQLDEWVICVKTSNEHPFLFNF